MALSNYSLGSLSGAISAAAQGFSKLLGKIVAVVAQVIDHTVELVGQILTPVLDTASQIPVLGKVVDTVEDLVNNLTHNLSDTLHNTSNSLLTNGVQHSVTVLLDNVTTVAGSTVSDVITSANSLVTHVVDPILNQLEVLPVIGHLATGLENSLDHVLNDVHNLGQYVAQSDIIDLGGDILANPFTALGGVLGDVTETIDSLLNSLEPALDSIPVAGDAVQHLGQGAVNILNHLSTGLNSIEFDVHSSIFV